MIHGGRTVLAAMVLTALVHAPAEAQESLDALLTPYLSEYELPALAVAVVKDGKVIAAGAVGTRKHGEKIPVRIDDKFHIGSDTKAMTAMLAAMMVEEGKLRWDSTVSEVFPELVEGMDPGLKGVTLTQLLSHTSGIVGDGEIFGTLIPKAQDQDGNLDEVRLWLLKEFRTEKLVAKPGTTFNYSNMGYAIAGMMIERASGKLWDVVISERIFDPLGLKSAGLGPQSTMGRIDATLGHVKADGKITAYYAGPNADNTPIIAPAGIAHMTVLDFAKWADWNAAEGRRGPKLVRPETLVKLHTPVIAPPPRPNAAPGTPRDGKYALGWGQVEVDWAPHPILHHAGSNTKNLAHIWVDTKRDFAFVVMANISNPKADEGFFRLAKEIGTKYAKP